MPKRRSWSRAAQQAQERPPEPLTASCERHRPRRTVIVRDGLLHCLACLGCPRCGARQIVEDRDDDQLYRQPVILEGRKIRGDWVCLRDNELIVAWSMWRRAMLVWRRGVAATRRAADRSGGYRRPEERAA